MKYPHPLNGNPWGRTGFFRDISGFVQRVIGWLGTLYVLNSIDVNKFMQIGTGIE
jgi:hypothetical protein